MDDSHTNNKVTRRGHTCFIILLNRAPIIWYGKRQNTVEVSTFSIKLIAAKYRVEHITALRFNFRMFGITVVEYTNMLRENASVVNNSSILSSTLNKKHISIAYHVVRWHVSTGVIKFALIDTNDNIADDTTKRLTAYKRGNLFGQWNS